MAWRFGGEREPGGASFFQPERPVPVDDLGDTIKIFDCKNCISQSEPKEFRLATAPVASFNVDIENVRGSKIAVPGAPMEFYPWPGGVLKKGGKYADVTTVQSPSFPMDPMVTAARMCVPAFQTSNLDFIGNVKCFYPILDFCVHALVHERAASRLPALELAAQTSEKRRIEIQSIGRILLIMRHEDGVHREAIGYGRGFEAACCKQPPSDVMAGFADQQVLRGPHYVVHDVQLGDIKLLASHGVNAAKYPDASALEDAFGRVGGVPDAGPISVVRGGFKGALNQLDIVQTASIRPRSNLVVSKWFQYVMMGVQNIYYGVQVRGDFTDPPPEIVTLEQVRDKCGLDESSAKRLLSIFEMILQQIADVIREQVENRPTGVYNFSIVPRDGYKILEIREKLQTAGGRPEGSFRRPL